MDLLDGLSGAVLDSQTLSNFTNGEYLVWDVSGSVQVRVTALVSNAVVSGVFFDSVSPAPPRIVGLSVANGIFRFALNGSAGSDYVVQVSTNLVDWSPLSTNTVAAGGSVPITDPAPANKPCRFYRAVLP